MAMKMTLLMQLGRSTWGEAHYWGAGVDPDGDPEQTAAGKLAQARAMLLGANASIFGVRLLSPTVQRNVTTLRFNPPLSGYIGGAQEEGTVSADVPNTSVMVAVKTKQRGKNFRVYLAGCIDEAIRTDPDFPSSITPDPNFVGPFNRWQAFLLKDQAWGTVVKTNPQSNAVSGIITNALFPGQVGVTMATPLNVGGNALAVGEHFQLRGFKRRNLAGEDINGVWQIGAIVPGTGTIVSYFLNASAAIDPSNFWKFGVAQTIVPVFDAYASYQLDRVTSRRRGGSIEQPRGRSRTRRSHA